MDRIVAERFTHLRYFHLQIICIIQLIQNYKCVIRCKFNMLAGKANINMSEANKPTIEVEGGLHAIHTETDVDAIGAETVAVMKRGRACPRTEQPPTENNSSGKPNPIHAASVVTHTVGRTKLYTVDNRQTRINKQ